jgi:hypothetical protein
VLAILNVHCAKYAKYYQCYLIETGSEHVKIISFVLSELTKEFAKRTSRNYLLFRTSLFTKSAIILEISSLSLIHNIK